MIEHTYTPTITVNEDTLEVRVDFADSYIQSIRQQPNGTDEIFFATDDNESLDKVIGHAAIGVAKQLRRLADAIDDQAG